MSFNPVAQFVFPGVTPEKSLSSIDRALSDMQQRINREFDRIDREKCQRYTTVDVSTGPYGAKLWELVSCNPGATALTVTLPTPGPSNMGARVGVTRASGTATVSVINPGGTISGAASYAVTVQDLAEFVCTGKTWRRVV